MRVAVSYEPNKPLIVEDLPTPVISKLSAATDALANLLVETEGFRGKR